MENKIFVKKFDNFLILNNNLNYKIFFFSISSKNFFFLFNYSLLVNLKLNNITFISNQVINNKKLNYFIFSWSSFLVKKMKVKHKISWLKIFRKIFFFLRVNYGFSYNIFYHINNVYLKKKRKYLKHSLVVFWNLNYENLYKTIFQIVSKQPIGCYTLRGFRFSRQKFIKRTGKISKYMDFKTKIF